MMPADLTKPFADSCCDGGETSITEMSCQPCGCDKGAKWVCKFHLIEAKMKEVREQMEEDLKRIANGNS